MSVTACTAERTESIAQQQELQNAQHAQRDDSQAMTQLHQQLQASQRAAQQQQWQFADQANTITQLQSAAHERLSEQLNADAYTYVASNWSPCSSSDQRSVTRLATSKSCMLRSEHTQHDSAAESRLLSALNEAAQAKACSVALADAQAELQASLEQKAVVIRQLTKQLQDSAHASSDVANKMQQQQHEVQELRHAYAALQGSSSELVTALHSILQPVLQLYILHVWT